MSREVALGYNSQLRVFWNNIRAFVEGADTIRQPEDLFSNSVAAYSKPHVGP